MSDGEGTPFVMAPSRDNGIPGPAYTLLGGDGAATFPDLSALGVELPHARSYSVVVFRNGAAPTVDDLAAKGPFFAPVAQPYTLGSSATQLVTTE